MTIAGVRFTIARTHVVAVRYSEELLHGQCKKYEQLPRPSMKRSAVSLYDSYCKLRCNTGLTMKL